MAAGGQLDVGTVQRASEESERESAAGGGSHSSPGATTNCRSRRPRSPAQPAMALSMPLNGLKEEDKEPLIELFVKVSARRPGVARVFPPHAPRRPHAASPRPEAEPCLPRPFPLSRPRVFPPRSGTLAEPAGGRTGGRGDREPTPQGRTPPLSRVGSVTLLAPSGPTPPRAAWLIAHPTYSSAGAPPV